MCLIGSSASHPPQHVLLPSQLPVSMTGGERGKLTEFSQDYLSVTGWERCVGRRETSNWGGGGECSQLNPGSSPLGISPNPSAITGSKNAHDTSSRCYGHDLSRNPSISSSQSSCFQSTPIIMKGAEQTYVPYKTVSRSP